MSRQSELVEDALAAARAGHSRHRRTRPAHQGALRELAGAAMSARYRILTERPPRHQEQSGRVAPTAEALRMSVTDSFWHPNNVPDDDDAAAYKAVHWAGLLNQAMDDPAGFGFVAAAVEHFAARVTKEDPTGPWAEYAALFISR